MHDLGEWQELEDLKYRATLVQKRNEANLSRHDLAVAARNMEAWVTHMEDFSYDPTLAELRRYAAAVGAVVRRQVIPIPIETEEGTP